MSNLVIICVQAFLFVAHVCNAVDVTRPSGEQRSAPKISHRRGVSFGVGRFLSLPLSFTIIPPLSFAFLAFAVLFFLFLSFPSFLPFFLSLDSSHFPPLSFLSYPFLSLLFLTSSCLPFCSGDCAFVCVRVYGRVRVRGRVGACRAQQK